MASGLTGWKGSMKKRGGACEWRTVRSRKWVVLGLVNAYEETSDSELERELAGYSWSMYVRLCLCLCKSGGREVISRGVTPYPLIIVAAGSRRTTRRPASILPMTRKSAFSSSASLRSVESDPSLFLSLSSSPHPYVDDVRPGVRSLQSSRRKL